MNLRKFVLRIALTAAVLTLAAFLVCPAYADDVTLTGPASVTITEGNSATVTFTATNVSSDTVEIGLFGESTGGFLTGDVSDEPVGGNVSPGTCLNATLGPGGFCTFSVTFLTDNPSGETDADFGGASSPEAEMNYCVVSPGACTGAFFVKDNFNITVTDPLATPEPSSAHLVLTGLAALLALGWLRSRI